MAAKKSTKKTSKKAAGKPAPGREAVKGAAPPPRPLGVVLREDAAGDRSPTLKKALKEWASGFNSPQQTVVASADEMKNVTELRRPSGIMPLDIDCGGGAPAGRLTVISGRDNAGKSFLMLQYLIMHQRLYGASSSIGIAAIEPFDFKRALKCGLVVAVPDDILDQWNKERELIGQPHYTPDEVKYFKRQVGEVNFFRGETGEQTMNTVLEAVRSKLFGIVCIDSLSVMLPSADAEKDVGETPMRAGNANLMTDFAKKYTPLTNALSETNETTVIGLMQVRANSEKATAGVFAKYMKDWATTGAWALKHLKSLDIQIEREGRVERTIQGVKYIVGKNLKWNITKGKDGARDGKSGEVPFYHQDFMPQGVDALDSIIVAGFQRGVICQSSRGVDIIHPITKERIDSAPSVLTLLQMLAADFEYELTVRRYILAAAGVECLYRR